MNLLRHDLERFGYQPVLAFKELAEAHIEASTGTPDASASEQQTFARQYLEKLINIEIRVPQLSDAAACAILQFDI